jgi:hypothetical protein
MFEFDGFDKLRQNLNRIQSNAEAAASNQRVV